MHRLAHNIHYRGASRSSREASRRPRVPPTRRHAPASVPARIPRGRPRTRRGAAAGSRPPARPSRRGRFPRACESPAHRPWAPARMSSWLTSGCRFRNMHDKWLWGYNHPTLTPPVDRGTPVLSCCDETIPAHSLHGRSSWDSGPEISSAPSARVISSRECHTQSSTN